MVISVCHNIVDNNRIFKDAKQETGGKTSQTRFGVNNGLGGRRALLLLAGKVNSN
jgi:hypothetical protein